ncbi:pilin [Halotalea alkalilenta]|uniref:Pilus assembly protein PilE n=1 Tax=Halotalea alkalilenta TaxID=376489 RepID=A0A172YEA5_9GAMM|nr:pilin [Halotalea alkalilenta]ANF57554.1 hypothetical protein A5892_08830 [Halotalea alkalilenta]
MDEKPAEAMNVARGAPRAHAQGGFTLLEMMAVVAIVGVLAAVAIPRYQLYVARSQVSSANMLLRAQQVGVEDLLLRGQEVDLAALGYSGDSVVHAHGSWSVEADGTLRYRFGTGASPLLAGEGVEQWLQLQPGAGLEGWRCLASAALEPTLLPPGCSLSSGG